MTRKKKCEMACYDWCTPFCGLCKIDRHHFRVPSLLSLLSHFWKGWMFKVSILNYSLLCLKLEEMVDATRMYLR